MRESRDETQRDGIRSAPGLLESLRSMPPANARNESRQHIGSTEVTSSQGRGKELKPRGADAVARRSGSTQCRRSGEASRADTVRVVRTRDRVAKRTGAGGSGGVASAMMGKSDWWQAGKLEIWKAAK